MPSQSSHRFLSKTTRALLCFFVLCLPLLSQAQNNTLTVKDITIVGNKKTKSQVILRELTFAINDTINLLQLAETLEKNELLLMNSGIFTQAALEVTAWDTDKQELDIEVSITEAWYIYPIPIFELADRNFNTWWEEFDRDWGRVNWGMRFYHTNFTGRRDRLKLAVQEGFTKKYEVEYKQPYINKTQTLGLNLNWLHSRNREIAYATAEDKLQFYRGDDEFLFRRNRFSAGLIYRPKLYASSSFFAEYHRNEITDFVNTDLNPQYFNNRLSQRYFMAYYQYRLDKRDIVSFPMHGHYFRGRIQKEGLGVFDDVNNFYAQATFKKYVSIGKKWSVEGVLSGKYSFVREQQPFYWQSRALGYEYDYIRGYELYVIDGMDYGYLKSSIHPYNPTTNALPNTLLYGTGVGLNIVVYYDKLIQIEYSVNKLGEKGLFLHWQLSFD